MTPEIAMRQRILDHAQELVQTLGYDGFSFSDVAARVGIRKASIHHHFPTKEDLGVRLVERFRVDCRGRLAEAESETDPTRRLLGYVDMFRETLRAGRMCLCGILAAGFGNIPAPLRAEVMAALDDQEGWLLRVIADGRARGHFRPIGEARDQARSLLSGLEGAMLLSRAHDDLAPFEAVARTLLGAIVSSPRRDDGAG